MMEGAHDLERGVLQGEPLGEFDEYVALMSLPHLSGTTLETIPAPLSYMHADPQRVEYWKSRLADDRHFKIGVAWAGRNTHPNDRNRSVPMEMFSGLAGMPQVHLYSLQKSDESAQARS